MYSFEIQPVTFDGIIIDHFTNYSSILCIYSVKFFSLKLVDRHDIKDTAIYNL